MAAVKGRNGRAAARCRQPAVGMTAAGAYAIRPHSRAERQIRPANAGFHIQESIRNARRSHAHELDTKPGQLVGKLFDRLFEIAKISNFTVEERTEYEAGLMNRWDYSASMKFAKEEGIAEGEARGVAIGETRGETKGILQTARKMKGKGFNIAVICEITGLPEAEVQAL